jgi:hypothetical protein
VSLGITLRRYGPETLLVLAVALPWLALLVLGMLWLWQGGHVWAWAIAAAALNLLAWPLVRLVWRRANAQAVHPEQMAQPNHPDTWNMAQRLAPDVAAQPFGEQKDLRQAELRPGAVHPRMQPPRHCFDRVAGAREQRIDFDE